MPSAAPVPPAQALPPLSLGTRLAFGAGDMGSGITANLLAFFLLPFLTNVAGLPPAIAGMILLISNLWDAIVDPWIGLMSDRTRSRLGRRYPWMLLGVLPLGISFALQWWVPFSSETGLFVFYLAVALVFRTAYAAVSLPYAALTAELSRDYDERTSLNAFRFSFSLGGGILALGIALALFSTIATPLAQYRWLGGITALLSMVPVLICVAGTWRRSRLMQRHYPSSPDSHSHGSSNPLKQFGLALANRPYRFALGLFVCAWMAVQVTSSVTEYYVTLWMRLPRQDFTLLALVVQGTAILALPLWSRICDRLGKGSTFIAGAGLWLLADLGLLLLQPGQTNLMWLLAVVVGLGVSSAYLVPWSMVPDTIELDELENGQRREGLFYSLMVLAQKLGLALALFLVGQLLGLAGYRAGHGGEVLVQPESALTAIRLAMAGLPALCLAGGIACAWAYPLTRDRHAEVLLKLEERRRSSAPD